MKKILVLGAGRTSAPLIDYLLRNSVSEDWFVTVADFSLQLAEEKTKDHPRARAIKFDIMDAKQKEDEISGADLVISILPASLHVKAAKQCLKSKSHFLSASYTSSEMSALNGEAKQAGLIFLNEMGVDPGIDHMDAKYLLNKIKSRGGEITSFKSYGGGLISPPSDDNCWGYKFTWSPMNVVNAGKDGGRYLKDGNEIKVPYDKIFLDTDMVEVPGLGKLETYPNRDAVAYLKKYGIEGVKNIYRGSLRKPGFCKAWNAIIKIGLTDEDKTFSGSEEMTYREWMNNYIPAQNGKTDQENLEAFLGSQADPGVMERLLWLDLFSENKINRTNLSSAEILLGLLESKWLFKENDSDITILQTVVDYKLGAEKKKLRSTLILHGYETDYTAMSRAVGLPLGIGARLILSGKIKERGVLLPVYEDIYEPVLGELRELGFNFREEEITV